MEFLNFGAQFARIMGRKRSYRVVAVFSYDCLGRLQSFWVFSGLSNKSDFYSNGPVFLALSRSF